MESTHKIILPNFLTANNVFNILTQNLNKQIIYNQVTKLDAITDAYILSILRLELIFVGS